MFKRLLVISAAALIIGAATVTQINAAEAETAKLGDANGDGAVDIVDVTVIQMHAAGLITLTGSRLAASDVDGSGITDIIDATAIQRYAAGMATGFAIGEEFDPGTIPTEPCELPTTAETSAPATDAAQTTEPQTVAPTTKKNYDLPIVWT